MPLAWFQVQETLVGTVKKYILHSAGRQQFKCPCLQHAHHPIAPFSYTETGFCGLDYGCHYGRMETHLMYTYLDPDLGYVRKETQLYGVPAVTVNWLGGWVDGRSMWTGLQPGASLPGFIPNTGKNVGLISGVRKEKGKQLQIAHLSGPLFYWKLTFFFFTGGQDNSLVP